MLQCLCSGFIMNEDGLATSMINKIPYLKCTGMKTVSVKCVDGSSDSKRTPKWHWELRCPDSWLQIDYICMKNISMEEVSLLLHNVVRDVQIHISLRSGKYPSLHTWDHACMKVLRSCCKGNRSWDQQNLTPANDFPLTRRYCRINTTDFHHCVNKIVADETMHESITIPM